MYRGNQIAVNISNFFHIYNLIPIIQKMETFK